MRKKFLFPAVLALMLTLLTVSLPLPAAAAGAYVSGDSGTVGSTVSVTVYGDSSNIAGVQLYLTYDTDRLSYASYSNGCGMEYLSVSGGGGSVSIVGNYNAGAGSFSVTVSFTATASGSAFVSCSGEVSDGDGNPSTASDSTSISITSLSSDASLSSLSVGSGSLSPSFSSSTTSYSVSVANSVTSLAVSASPNDSEASVSVSGNGSLSVGSNTVYVTVTAGDGTTRTYTISVTRAQGAAETTVSSGDTSTTADTTTASAVPMATLNDGTQLEITDFDTAAIPKGFSRTTVTFDGQDIPAVQYSADSQKLVWLTGNETYAAGFYYFDVKTGLVTPLSSLSSAANSYLLLDPTDDISVPAGYTKQKLTIGTQSVWVYAPSGSAKPDHYLVCAVSPSGVLGLYLYDPQEGTLQRYEFATLSDTGTDTADTTETTAAAQTAAEKNTLPGFLSRFSLTELILIGASVILLALFFVFLFLFLSKNRRLRSLQAALRAPAPKKPADAAPPVRSAPQTAAAKLVQPQNAPAKPAGDDAKPAGSTAKPTGDAAKLPDEKPAPSAQKPGSITVDDVIREYHEELRKKNGKNK